MTNPTPVAAAELLRTTTDVSLPAAVTIAVRLLTYMPDRDAALRQLHAEFGTRVTQALDLLKAADPE